MKIKNSTAWNDWMLRRMISWCCKELDMPIRAVRLAVFRNSRSTWGGCARGWRGQISVCVTTNEAEFPANASTHGNGERFIDRMECLVAVTAHELYHVAAHCVTDHRQRTRGYGMGQGSSERVTCAQEIRVLNLFRQSREPLLAEWNITPERAAKPQITIVDKRKAKAIADLEKWERKLKLAKTKVAKMKRRVKYYSRAENISQPNS